MSYHLRNTLTAVAAVVALGTAAYADEATVKEVTVHTDYTSLADANAKDYYPTISDDLMAAIANKIQIIEAPEGYVLDVNVQKVSLDGDTILPDSAEFNEMEGVATLTSPLTNANSESYPIMIKAMSAGGVVADGVTVIQPSETDFYNAMVDGFADAIVDKLPENLRNSSSK